MPVFGRGRAGRGSLVACAVHGGAVGLLWAVYGRARLEPGVSGGARGISAKGSLQVFRFSSWLGACSVWFDHLIVGIGRIRRAFLDLL